jgi:hypothetical protein
MVISRRRRTELRTNRRKTRNWCGQGGSSDPSAFAETYTIDPWGNQTESGSFNFTQAFTGNNQINASGYSYDTAGDLTADGLGNSYTYNVDGMLTASGSTQYSYDALDQRRVAHSSAA